MPILKYSVKGIKKKASNARAHTRLPVTQEILRAMKVVWQKDPDSSMTTMLWAVMCMCFFGLLRSGKVVVPSDLEYDPVVNLSFGMCAWIIPLILNS